MADRENCTWAKAIFERSGSTRVRTMKTMTMTKGSTVFPPAYLKQGGPPGLILEHQRKRVEFEAII